MAIRGKQRPPLASQSIAKAFWVTLVHTETLGYTHRRQGDTPQGHIRPKKEPQKNTLSHKSTHSQKKRRLKHTHRITLCFETMSFFV